MGELEHSWDIFIAHADGDRGVAETLYDLLAADARVFLDTKCLRLGDQWDLELARAQQASLITVVLVSTRSELAFYQREEIAAATALARKDSEAHRVVPLYLAAEGAQQPDVPYGLRLRHGLHVSDQAQLRTAVARLRELVNSLRSEANVPRAAGQSSGNQPANQNRERATPETVTAGVPGTIDFGDVRRLDLINETERSATYRCVYDGRACILKRTAESWCDASTLSNLIGASLQGWAQGLRALVATPLAVWVSDGFVWELHQRHAGISLLEMVLRSSYKTDGALLGVAFAAMFDAICELHNHGIVHRDVTPSNILFDGQTMTLIDISFACRPLESSKAVGNALFAAPEQRDNAPVAKSDWYSLAGTIFFLANGYGPHERGEKAFENGISNIEVGNWSTSSLFEGHYIRPVRDLVRKLLEPDVINRPDDRRQVRLQPNSAPMPGLPFRGILDLGEYGHIVTAAFDWFPLPSKLTPLEDLVRNAQPQEDFRGGKLRQEIVHLMGEYRRRQSL